MKRILSTAICVAPLALFLDTAVARSPQGWWETAFNHSFNPNDASHPWAQFQPLNVPNGPRFNAIHMALIPKGLHAGKVIMWDWHNYGPNVPSLYQQRWSILDPVNQTFLDGLLVLTNQGDPMCAGHTWSADGDLVISGGNYYTIDQQQTPRVFGHKLIWLYQPPPTAGTGMGTWTPKKQMAAARWYPTVTLLADGKMMFSGGSATGPSLPRSTTDFAYELYDPATDGYSQNVNGPRYGSNFLFYGPGLLSGNVASKLSDYPRIHVLPYGSGSGTSAGMVFASGYGHDSARADIDLVQNTTENWFYPTGAVSWHNSIYKNRHDGSAFLYPNLGLNLAYENTIVRLGGLVDLKQSPFTKSVTNTVEYCVAHSTPSAWTAAPSLLTPRQYCNAVLLPDGSILVIGGTKNYYDPTQSPIPDPNPAQDAEHLAPAPGSGTWTSQGAMASSRNYHSTALLLPSGKVLSAGGEFGWVWTPTPTGGRTYDFQIFNPPYMSQNRPTIVSAPTTMSLLDAGEFTTYKVYYSYPWDDANVAKVVLMAPGSITHHSDMHQRYVECAVVGLGGDAAGNFIRFYPPLKMGVPSPAGSHALPGYYMLFILTDNTGPQFRGVPSQATWVKLQ